MHRKTIFAVLLLAAFGFLAFQAGEKEAVAEKTEDDTLTTIAFGSCNKQDKPQTLWGPIVKDNPDLWIWLGDNIYGDSEEAHIMKGKYDIQLNNKDYQALMETCPIIGTWDDHDYGKNDGTKHFPAKEQNKELLLNFLGVPEDAPVREREGIYQAYNYGSGDKKVKVIVLDTRTFRDKVSRGPAKKAYVPDPDADILGAEQWQWLAKELKSSDAALTLVVNGSQVISRFHPYEKWGNYPTSRKKLFKMIGDLCPTGVVLLSGDRHHAEISKVNIPGMTHPLYEFTASGMTHNRKYDVPEPNKFRVGKKWNKLNYGVIKINWEASPIVVTMEIKGENGERYQETSFEVTP